MRAREGLGWLLGRWRRAEALAYALAPAPGFEPEPEPVPEPAQPGPVPGFTTAERVQLCQLAEWWRTAGQDARQPGADLADRLRGDLPDVPPSLVARVLLSAGRRIEEWASAQDSDYTALRVSADAMLGAPLVLAEIDEALAELDADLTELAEERP